MKRYLWMALILALAPVPAAAQEEDPGTESDQSSPFSQAKFVPDISLILDVAYLHRNLSDARYGEVSVPGLGHSHEHAAPVEGFNLNYAEISFYSVVDPYFELFAVLHLSEEHSHLEEAYGLTKKIPGGFQVKAGKFLSSFGRLNEQHSHYWDFSDRPLIHRAVFGGEGLNEVGARVTWVAPLETYLLLGGELLMGNNEAGFGRTAIYDAGGNLRADGVNGPGLALGYCKTSIDIGEASVLAGVSAGGGEARHDDGLSTGEEGGHAVEGNTVIYGGELTIKYPLDAVRELSFQSEYIGRSVVGTRFDGAAAPPADQSTFDLRQSGFYVQAAATFELRWRAGLRFDMLGRNDVVVAGTRSDIPENLPRFSGMVEYNPTEFSRIRLQYNQDRSGYTSAEGGLTETTVHEISLQLNLAIGAHGAHSF